MFFLWTFRKKVLVDYNRLIVFQASLQSIKLVLVDSSFFRALLLGDAASAAAAAEEES